LFRWLYNLSSELFGIDAARARESIRGGARLIVFMHEATAAVVC